MKVTVKFEGGRQLDAALNQFDERKRRTIGRKALDSAGEIIAKSMRSKVAVDTGGLRESIDVSGTLNKSAKSAHPKVAEQERYVGPDGRPSGIQTEFGNEHQSAQPFARPAFDETKDEALKRIGDELWLGIDKAATAAARKAAK